MTRRFILFLALLLPLQFAWASAATYCGHETQPAESHHVGHHEHQHQAGKSPDPLATDNDCGTCHAAGSIALLDAVAMPQVMLPTASIAPHASSRVPTVLSRAPDRPQWLRLA